MSLTVFLLLQQGPDLLETSSELIYSGELSKVNSSGWTQERYFFLFDHQLIYCRKVCNRFSFLPPPGQILLFKIE